jgi:MFS family permease
MGSCFLLLKKVLFGSTPDDKQHIILNRITVSVFFFLSGIILSTFTSRIPGLQERFSLNNAQLGVLLACLPIGLIISMPFAGFITNKYSIKTVLTIAAISFVLLLLVLGFSRKVWQLYVVLFLFGVTRTFYNVSINTISVLLQSHYKKKIINSFHGIWSLATLLGALVSLILIGNDVSLEIHIISISIFCFLIILVFYKKIPTTTSSSSQFKLISSKQKRLLWLGLIAFGTMFCEGIMGDWSGIYFEKIGLVSKKYYVIGYAFYLTAMLIGRFWGDKLIDKFGELKIIRTSSLLLSSGFLISIVFTQPFLITIGFVLVGFGVSCIIPIAFLLSSKNTSVPVGMAISTVSMMGYVGFLIGSPLIGFISNSFNLRWAFLTCLLFSISIFFFSKKYASERG